MPGSWITKGFLMGKKITIEDAKDNPIGLHSQFTADAEDGSIPDLIIPAGISGFLFGLDVKFYSTAPPNNLTIIVKSPLGNTKWAPTKLTDSGWIQPDLPIPIPGGCIITFEQDDDPTNSAQGEIVPEIG